MKALSKPQAEQISGLINSLTIWMLAVEREDNTSEQTIQYMKWHDEIARKLEVFGLSVAKYNHTETV